MSRKDSKGMFANVLGQLGDQPAQPPSGAAKPLTSPHLMKVAAGVRQIQERGELADRMLKDGGHVVEIDPAVILPSPIPDRFEGAYDEAAVSELKESMRERGQIVPGLVRPFKGEPGRYQIVYGRRRLAAARQLGITFKAVIRELSDEDAIIYQGEENSARNDLTFIEKCSFALAQEKAGFSRATISASLSTGKSHISEMIRIASTLPISLLHAIGPVPEIGRRRWLEMIEKWNAQPHSHELVEMTLAEIAGGVSGEERFALAMSSMLTKTLRPEPKGKAPVPVISKGFKLAEITYGKSGTRMSFGKSVPPDFVTYLAEHIENIHDAYLKEMKAKVTRERS
jgi:ParB family transcriptional regulator, chromosome partitioning protein